MRAGLPDPVLDGQAIFRAVLDALSRPGRSFALPASLSPPAFAPPAPLTPELAAVALALGDGTAPLWLDETLRGAPDVAAYLRFHTGAALVADPAAAAFALVRDPRTCPPFGAFALGSPDYPDRSTTLVLAVDGFDDRAAILLEGPGIETRARLGATPLPPDLPARLAVNRALYPRGVDLLLAGAGRVAGIPRSSLVVGSGDAWAEAA